MGVSSNAHLSITSSGCEDQVSWEVAPVAHFQREPSSDQTKRGACRSKGLVAGQHVPDRLGELPGELDLRDLWAALTTEAFLGALVALSVEGVVARVQRGLEQRPAQILGPVL